MKLNHRTNEPLVRKIDQHPERTAMRTMMADTLRAVADIVATADDGFIATHRWSGPAFTFEFEMAGGTKSEEYMLGVLTVFDQVAALGADFGLTTYRLTDKTVDDASFEITAKLGLVESYDKQYACAIRFPNLELRPLMSSTHPRLGSFRTTLLTIMKAELGDDVATQLYEDWLHQLGQSDPVEVEGASL